VERAWQSDSEHISLPTAAAVVYHWTVGKAPRVASVRELNALMDQVAHALANVATIYYLDSSETPCLLEPQHLVDASFDRGATILRNRNGAEFRGLTMRRGEMRAAVNIVRRARITFQEEKLP
jgi:hypothetical protein